MAFWKKFYKSKYTGAEIDAAIAKADNVPAVTVEDAGKAIVVNEVGKIVAGDGFAVSYVRSPEAFDTALNTLIQSLAADLMLDTKLHTTKVEIARSDPGFEDIYAFFGKINHGAVMVDAANIGVVYSEVMIDGSYAKTCLKNYMNVNGMGFGELIILIYPDLQVIPQKITVKLYARRIEMAS